MTNDTTPAPTGADALREALKWAAAALQAIAPDEDTVRDNATGETRSVGQILDAADAALASAAQRDLLRDFARAVMQAWPEGGIDGGELQDIALAHGLLRQAVPPADWDGCHYYERTELIK